LWLDTVSPATAPLMEARAETLWFLHTGGVSKLHYLWAKMAFTLLLEVHTIWNKLITSIIYVNLHIIQKSQQFASHHQV
jgi:hypothetical protein